MSELLDLFRRAWRLLTPAERKRAVGVFAVMLGAAALEFVGVGSVLPFLQIVMDPAQIQEQAWLRMGHQLLGSPDTRTFLLIAGGAVLGLVLLTNAIAALSSWVQFRFTWSVHHSLSLRLMKSYLVRPYTYFLDSNTSELNKNLLQEIQRLVGGIFNPALVLISRTLVAGAILLLLLVTEPVITLAVVGVTGAAYAVIYIRVRRRLEELGAQTVEADTDRFKVAQEAFGGIKDVKVLGREETFLSRFEGPSKVRRDNSVQQSIYSKLPRYLIQGMLFGGVMTVLLVLLWTGAPTTRIVPVLGLFAFAGYRILPAIQSILKSLTSFRYNDRLFEVLYRDLVETEPEREIEEFDVDPKPLPFAEEIRLEDVSFSYAGTDEHVIEDWNLTIPQGRSVALVGPTGAGKTTVADIVMGLLNPTEGKLTVDGTRIDDGNVRRWRRNVGYVPQEIFMSDDTIARNIAFGLPDDEVDREAVERAAKVAHIHDFIVEDLPDGYDTVIGERGVRLSGGQRQRIGIARALYEDPPVLVFDEATSDIDNVTQDAITDAVGELPGEKTLLVIAHRLATIRSCDEIVLVQDGRMADRGSYRELMQDNPTFQELAERSEVTAET